MKDWKRQVDEMSRATEQLLAALNQDNQEQIMTADLHCAQALSQQAPQEVIDLNSIEDIEEREQLRRSLRRLEELTRICIDRANRMRNEVGSELSRLQGVRRNVDATLFNTSTPKSVFDQNA